MSTVSVGYVEREFAEAINALRVAEYGKAPGFKVNREAIEWNASDDQCCILAAWSGERIIATMRVELADNLDIIERKLECPWTFGRIDYPAVILSKAATDGGHRRLGLNTVLRYWAFRLALRWDAAYFVGTFVSGSPRENALREMGYEFYVNPLGWHRADYRSERPVTVAKLDFRATGHRALAAAERIAGGEVESRFPWRGPFPEKRFVSVIK